MGRPPVGDGAMTAAERKRRYRERRKAGMPPKAGRPWSLVRIAALERVNERLIGIERVLILNGSTPPLVMSARRALYLSSC
jgi:hypothetical protein